MKGYTTVQLGWAIPGDILVVRVGKQRRSYRLLKLNAEWKEQFLSVQARRIRASDGEFALRSMAENYDFIRTDIRAWHSDELARWVWHKSHRLIRETDSTLIERAFVTHEGINLNHHDYIDTDVTKWYCWDCDEYIERPPLRLERYFGGSPAWVDKSV